MAQTDEAFSVVNGSQDLPLTSGPPSSSGSKCSAVVFSKEDVDTLLNEKFTVKSKRSYKRKTKKLVDYTRRLRKCIKWSQQLEGNYVAEQGKIKKLLEALQEKLAKEEADRLAAERSHASLAKELRREKMCKQLQEYNTNLQQYNTSLQEQLHQEIDLQRHSKMKRLERRKY